MIKVGVVYYIKQIRKEKAIDGRNVTKILVKDKNFGHPVWYELVVIGNVIACENDPIVIGQITAVSYNRWSVEYQRFIKTPKVYCTLTGVNVIP